MSASTSPLKCGASMSLPSPMCGEFVDEAFYKYRFNQQVGSVDSFSENFDMHVGLSFPATDLNDVEV